MDDPEINAGVARPQVGERRKEGVIAAVKDRNVHPVDAAGRGCNQRVGKVDRFAEVGRREARPAAERAEA